MIEWNKVTWYSKLGAVILFIGIVPALTFCIGRKYEETIQVVHSSPVSVGVNSARQPRPFKESSSGINVPYSVGRLNLDHASYVGNLQVPGTFEVTFCKDINTISFTPDPGTFGDIKTIYLNRENDPNKNSILSDLGVTAKQVIDQSIQGLTRRGILRIYEYNVLLRGIDASPNHKFDIEKLENVSTIPVGQEGRGYCGAG